jgi:hypothetical protein
LSVPIVHDATPDDAESIGEAHAEAWRIGYDELFPVPCCYFPCPVVISRALLEGAVALGMWVGLVGVQHSVERC